MNKRQFIRQRTPSWKRFETLVHRAERASVAKLSAREVSEFSRLLRELSNDLAIIRSHGWDQRLASYLNDLVAHGHNSFYRAPPGNLAFVVQFFSTDYPRLFRRYVGYFWAAAACFFLPLIVSWALIQNDPSLAARVLPNAALENFDEMYESDLSEREGFGEGRAMMAGFYVRNNVGIALKCFAQGLLFGIPTIYTLLQNGIAIGAVGGYVVSLGHGQQFLSFVVSHGSFELTAIAVSGGAGLMLGNALLHPGQRTRKEALLSQGMDAVRIAAGAAVMLMIAALIEAFWSPSGVPNVFKYIVGFGLWMLVFMYLTFAGRGASSPAVPNSRAAEPGSASETTSGESMTVAGAQT